MRGNSAAYQPWENREVPLDDMAMRQHARALAVTLNAPRRAPLVLCPREEYSAVMREARRLAGETETLPASLEWLRENGRMADSLFAALRPSARFSLPAREDGLPRIQALLEEIARHSDAPLTPERLTGCLTAFDEVRALEMNELWAVPSALSAVLQRAYVAAAKRAAAAQKERVAALRWVDSGAALGAGGLSGRGSAFFECALQALNEREEMSKRAALEKWLSDHDRPAEKVIALEHERQALDRLRLDHALAALRMLKELDWSECFGRVSRVEQTLSRDPAGTYPRMDAASRALVRGRVTHLAGRCNIGEATLSAAALAAAGNGEGGRREITWWFMTDEGTEALLRGMGVKARGVKRIHPDPGARKYRAGVLLLAAALTALLFRGCGWRSLIALPVALCASAQALARLAGRLVQPRRLLRMDADAPLPEAWRAMVVMPVLLSSPGRASETAF